MSEFKQQLEQDILQSVRIALEEDIRSGDLTSKLIPADSVSTATIITREKAVLCGQSWVESVFSQLQSQNSQYHYTLTWHAKDGDTLNPNDKIATIQGSSQLLLTGERTALNYLQTLSATATTCAEYASLVEGTQVKLLDTRKTIPTLRTAQKYAVTCGGCYNHRIGLYDAFLIKENHIMAAGSIQNAVTKAKSIAQEKTVEVEVENLSQLLEAVEAQADVIMLDNFSFEQIHEAIRIAAGKALLEISGNVDKSNLRKYAEAGVDYISIGGLTKHIRAIDLSMRFKN